MCQTTINQSTVIANISVGVTKTLTSLMYDLNGITQEIETIETPILVAFTEKNRLNHWETEFGWNYCDAYGFLECMPTEVVRLWLIEKYK